MSFDADKELDLLRRKTLDLAAKPHLPADLRDVLAHAYAAWLPARAREHSGPSLQMLGTSGTVTTLEEATTLKA